MKNLKVRLVETFQKYRVAIGELLFVAGASGTLFGVVYQWSNSVVASLAIAEGTFAFAVFLSYLLHRTANKVG